MKVRRFFESVYHDNDLRQVRTRDLSGDLARYAGNRALRPIEEALIAAYRRDDLPPIFIVGVPRSGTTLLYQLMARHLTVGFVNNYMARFWMAPIVGGIVDRIVHEGERSIPLESYLGGTPGDASPHEFSWFWEFWTEFGDVDAHTDRELAEMDWQTIRREIEGLAGWFGQPVVFKSINYVDYHIPWFEQHFADPHFVWMRRNPPYVAQSIYQSRLKRYDDASVWWSVRPRDVEAWLDRPPAEQIAHQINDITRAIQAGFSELPADRRHVLDYTDLTRDAPSTIRSLADALDVGLRHPDDLDDLGLSPRNEQRLDDATFDELTQALETIR